MSSPEPSARPAFDLQAHRGGAGRWPENTLEAFGRALALGVSTLELDVHLTAEDDVVVAHDPHLGNASDARAIRTLTRRDLPDSMPLLRQVAALLEERGAAGVGVNLEIKYDAVAAACDAGPTVAHRGDFVDVVLEALRVDGLLHRTSVQCFDWGVLRLVGRAAPGLARNLLVAPRYLAGSPDGSTSQWFGDVEVQSDFVAAAARQGFDAISPVHGSPFRSGVEDPAYRPFTDAALVRAAHESGLRVIPYTVDDPATMVHLIDLGVDGLITDVPGVLREVMAERGLPLPPAFPG